MTRKTTVKRGKNGHIRQFLLLISECGTRKILEDFIPVSQLEEAVFIGRMRSSECGTGNAELGTSKFNIRHSLFDIHQDSALGSGLWALVIASDRGIRESVAISKILLSSSLEVGIATSPWRAPRDDISL